MATDFTSLAQRKIKTGEHAPTFSIKIGSEGISSEIKDLSVTYNSDGSSESTIHSYSSLRGLENGVLTVDVGYGGVEGNYFTGTLEHVEDTHWGDSGEAIAWGPFKLMAEQQLLTQVDYYGWYIDRALMDLVNRTNYRSGATEIVAGKSYLIEGESLFTLETGILEAAEALCESANFVMTDRPYGRRLFMPRPRAGATAKAKAQYNDGNMPAGSFVSKGNRNGFYSRVVVFRRNDDGNLAFPMVDIAVANETRYQPSKNKAYIVPEFNGNSQQAKEEGAMLAEYLRRGTYNIELTGLPANPSLLLHDTVDFNVTEFRQGRKRKDVYDVKYKCVLDQGIILNIARTGNTMDMNMTGIKVYEKLRPAVYPVSMKSAGVV